MTVENRLWQALTIIVALLSAVIPAGVALHLSNNPPRKELVTEPVAPNDLLSQLTELGPTHNMSLTVDKQPVTNIVFFIATLKNTGTFPISTHDYETGTGLTISIDPPWKMIAVSNFPSQDMHPDWQRVNDRSFQAPAQLFNPNDSLSINVYVADSEKPKPSIDDLNKIQFKWAAHIENVPPIHSSSDSIFDESKKMWGISVYMYGWGFVLFALLSITFFFSYLYLSSQVQALNRLPTLWRTILIVVMGIVSVSAGESISTYATPSLLYRFTPPSPWYNLPPIIINCLFLSYLTLKFVSKRDNYGLAIEQPPQDSLLSLPTLFSGSIARPLPFGWGVWVFTVNPSDKSCWPQHKAKVSHLNWELNFTNKSAVRDRDVFLQFFLVGPLGQTKVIDYRERCQQTANWSSFELPSDCIELCEPLTYHTLP